MPNSDKPLFDPPTPAQIRGPKRLLSVVAIASCCIFFACAGCCFLTIFMFGPQVVKTPAGANEVASRITDWRLPASFSGKSGVTMDNILFRFDVARFAQRQGRGILIVGQLHSKLLPYAEQRSQLQDFMDRIAPELKKIDLEEPETRTMTIRGLSAEFQLGRGEDRASTTRYQQVIGSFRGKLDDVILILQGEEGFLTNEEIDEFLKSIE